MILFVCHGNVARSQFGEALARKAGVAEVASAGTHVSARGEGNRLIEDGPAAVRIVEHFKAITGLDIGSRTRTGITPGLAEEADTIIVLTDPLDLPPYFDKHKRKMLFWQIDDPHHMDLEGCRQVVAAIESHMDEIRDTH